MSGNAAPRQNNWPEIGGHDIWKVTKIKVEKFGPHSVASEITEDPRKQKSHRIWRLFQRKRFHIRSFMSKKKFYALVVMRYYGTMYCFWTKPYPIPTKNRCDVNRKPNLTQTWFKLDQCLTELGRFANSSEEHSDILWGTEVLI